MSDSNSREILIFSNSDAIADFAVKKWRDISTQSVECQGVFAAALSGGRTPLDFYERLSTYRGTLPWDRTHIFFADERYVPPDDKDSNYNLIQQHLIRKIDIPPQNVHPVSPEQDTLEHSATRYEKDIRGFFGIRGDAFPAFDLTMLGIGEDGHTASLFPGTAALHESRRLAIPIIADRFPQERISLSLPVLNNAKNILFLVSGGKKAKVMREILEDEDTALPAALVQPSKGSVVLLLDGPAASLLSMKRPAQ